MRWPMLLLAVGCVAGGLLAPALLALLGPVVATASGIGAHGVRQTLAWPSYVLANVVTATGALIVLIIGLIRLRWGLLRDRAVTEAETWGCGYAKPTPRMQYTASSFAQPFTELFRLLLLTKKQQPLLTDYFPKEAALATETPEPCSERVYRPLFGGIGWALGQFRWLQHGRVQLYVLYIALTILFLLVWYLGFEV